MRAQEHSEAARSKKQAALAASLKCLHSPLEGECLSDVKHVLRSGKTVPEGEHKATYIETVLGTMPNAPA